MSQSKNEKIISMGMKKMGFDPNKLSKELRNKSVQNMSHKERCEYINEMKLPFGIVRCTPNLLLKKWLGIDILSIIDVFSQSMLMMKENSKNNTGSHFSKIYENYLTQTSFHISHIKDGEVYDWGFFIDHENSKLPIDEIIDEGVIDLSFSDENYTVGLGPDMFQKLSAHGEMKT
jgi:hypothetical protein